MMTAKETEEVSTTLRNTFLAEVRRYESVIGNMDVSGGDAFGKVAQTMNNRIHAVIGQIEELYETYSERANPAQDFFRDFPHLQPVVEGLAILVVKDGKFAINDLRVLARGIPVLHAPQPAEQKKPDSNAGNGNPFSGLKP